MKKKELKLKLTFDRETVKRMEAPALRVIVGGYTFDEGSCGTGCNSRNTCGTRYC